LAGRPRWSRGQRHQRRWQLSPPVSTSSRLALPRTNSAANFGHNQDGVERTVVVGADREDALSASRGSAGMSWAVGAFLLAVTAHFSLGARVRFWSVGVTPLRPAAAIPSPALRIARRRSPHGTSPYFSAPATSHLPAVRPMPRRPTAPSAPPACQVDRWCSWRRPNGADVPRRLGSRSGALSGCVALMSGRQALESFRRQSLRQSHGQCHARGAGARRAVGSSPRHDGADAGDGTPHRRANNCGRRCDHA
jgi:hypothetical protein